MSFTSSSSFRKADIPLRFHQVKHEGETINNIIARYNQYNNVDIQRVLQDNPGVKTHSDGKIKIGEMIVLSFKV